MIRMQKEICLGFEEDDELIEGNIILGTTFMRNYDIFLDQEDMLIGFVQSRCNPKDTSYKHLLSKKHLYSKSFNQKLRNYHHHKNI